jgi:hypothetical protein
VPYTDNRTASLHRPHGPEIYLEEQKKKAPHCGQCRAFQVPQSVRGSPSRTVVAPLLHTLGDDIMTIPHSTTDRQFTPSNSCPPSAAANGDPKPPPARPVKPPATALSTALDLLRRGFWPVAIYPPGVKLGKRVTKGKEPIGKKWGAERWTEQRLRDTFRKYPTAGVGICFGPGRGPNGSWLIDLEGDGPQAAESLTILLGGEIIPTLGWSSTRGTHTVFTADGGRLLKLLAEAGGKEGTGIKSGVWHLDALPDLEIRIGGYHPDESVKQVQSVVPPTCGRRWNDA